MRQKRSEEEIDSSPEEAEKASDEKGSLDLAEQLRMERENVEQLKAQLQQATSEKESWMNKYYSSLADVQNLRKDIQKEGENARKFAAEPVLKKLIPFMQSMDQAFRYEPTDDPKSASWIKGIHMAYRQLIKALEELEIKEIDPAPGDAFDAYTMEAVGAVVSDEPDLVSEVLMRGFTLHGRLIQPASVTVTVTADEAPGKEPEAEKEATEPAEQSDEKKEEASEEKSE